METSLIISLGSLVFIAVGYISMQRGERLIQNGKKTSAIIFKNIYKSTGSKNGGLYHPVIRFTTEKKEWITQELNTGYMPAKPQGKKIKVIYDPENSSIVEINSIFQLIILPRFLLAMGIVGFVFGLLEYIEIIHVLSEYFIVNLFQDETLLELSKTDNNISLTL